MPFRGTVDVTGNPAATSLANREPISIAHSVRPLRTFVRPLASVIRVPSVGAVPGSDVGIGLFA